jgi:hypothetical protein
MMMVMSKYETTLRTHWVQHRPDELAGMADPVSFFSDLSRQVQSQVEELAEQIAGESRPGEEYLTRLGRLREARMSAESDVLRQVLAVPDPQDPQAPWPASSTDWMTPELDPDDPIQAQALQDRQQHQP